MGRPGPAGCCSRTSRSASPPSLGAAPRRRRPQSRSCPARCRSGPPAHTWWCRGKRTAQSAGGTLRWRAHPNAARSCAPGSPLPARHRIASPRPPRCQTSTSSLRRQSSAASPAPSEPAPLRTRWAESACCGTPRSSPGCRCPWLPPVAPNHPLEPALAPASAPAACRAGRCIPGHLWPTLKTLIASGSPCSTSCRPSCPASTRETAGRLPLTRLPHRSAPPPAASAPGRRPAPSGRRRKSRPRAPDPRAKTKRSARFFAHWRYTP
mmetsp:Transcript_72128/g.172283  ORF Transcript_72128/g.172283 Transcript_72128/m.172283 type:complete len:266 (+) Transcript_72128:1014-1811(+)